MPPTRSRPYSKPRSAPSSPVSGQSQAINSSHNTYQRVTSPFSRKPVSPLVYPGHHGPWGGSGSDLDDSFRRFLFEVSLVGQQCWGLVRAGFQFLFGNARTSLSGRLRKKRAQAAGGGVVEDEKAEKAARKREWSGPLIALLILTNAALVYFNRGSKEGWGFIRAGERDLRQTRVDPRSVSKITPEELDRVLNEDVERFAVRIRRRHITTGHGLQGFVLFSSYRVAPYSFVALGLTPLTFHSLPRTNSCRWDDAGGVSMNGTVTVHYPGEAFRKEYECMILACELPHDIMSKRVATRERPVEALALGGNLTIIIDKDPVVVFREVPGTPLELEPYKKNNYPHRITLCTSPVSRPLHAERVRQWMHYHANVHGVDFYTFYDAGGMDYDMGQVLEEFWSRGMVEVRDIRDTIQYDSYHHSELLAINDCLYRTKYSSRWTLYLDFDMYLTIPPPVPPPADPNSTTPAQATASPVKSSPAAPGALPGSVGESLLVFMQTQEGGKLPWVSFGMYVYSVHHCDAMADVSDGDEYAVERMAYRESQPYCRAASSYKRKELCLKSDGLRKFVINPRTIVANQINRILSGDKNGFNAPTQVIRVNYFRGLAEKERTLCTFTWGGGKHPDRLVRDDSVTKHSVISRQKQRTIAVS